MKTATLLPLAAAAVTAFIVPTAKVLAQLEAPVHRGQQEQQPCHEDASWRGWLPSAESVKESVYDLFDTVSTDVEDMLQDVRAKLAPAELDFNIFNGDEFDMGKPRGHKKPNATIYQLISTSKYTTRFAQLVNEYDDIVQLLNSTEANYTLFVPVDSAFEHLPKDKKPSKEFIESVLKYHIGLGLYPAGRVLVTHTLPTALDEPLLGDKPQRLRTSVGLLSGVRVNFYSKVVAVDIRATNGFIHAVKSLIVPPPYVGRELSLFPAKFSTLLLAFDKTNFTSYIHGIKMTGSTTFAPDNAAFAKLGPAANAFLFNTEKGLGYLKAILKYHVVPNEVFYSDAFYSSGDDKKKNGGVDESDDVGRGHFHLDVPTLLDDKSIAIDVSRWAGFITVKLNGYIGIKVGDAIAKNGVFHIPGSVLLPPHKHGEKGSAFVDGEISVEELMARLDGYVEKSGAAEIEL